MITIKIWKNGTKVEIKVPEDSFLVENHPDVEWSADEEEEIEE